MREYTYTQGQWTETNSLPPWEDADTSETWLNRAGYSTHLFGVGIATDDIKVFPSQDDTKDGYLAQVCPDGSRVYDVVLPDFPSLMLFLRDFGPAFSAMRLDSRAQDFDDIMRKLFRVYHGHDMLSVCQECDPDEWAAREEFRKRRGTRGAR